MRPLRALVLPCLLLVLCLVSLGSAEEKGPRFEAERKGPHGTVILLNNCDDSEDTGQPPDNKDGVINGKKDLAQLEPIQIRGPAKGEIELQLAGYDPKDKQAGTKVRVFTSAGTAILGPRLPNIYKLSKEERTQLGKGGLTLYAEGLQFAATVRLQLLQGGKPSDELVLQVAPFLLVPHTQPPLLNMVVRTPTLESKAYVKRFQAACAKAKKAASLPDEFKVQVVKAPDQWMEDELQWGYTDTPRCKRPLPVALHMYRGGNLRTAVENLLGPGVGYFQAFNYNLALPDSMNFGGNLEVTPPVKGYPFGRVYYGSVVSDPDEEPSPPRNRHIADGFQEFFKNQKRHPKDKEAIQEPIGLCTDWLWVGHVDEIVSFVPVPKSEKHPNGFVLLWASPTLALNLLDTELSDEQRKDKDSLAKTPEGTSHYQNSFGVTSVAELLALKGTRYFPAGMSLTAFNKEVDRKVHRAVQEFENKLKLTPDEIKPIPVLFRNNSSLNWKADALTPGMVNLSSMGTVSLIPDPYIPLFRKYVKTLLVGLEQKEPIFIDDWVIYHAKIGEVHCGSNMQRQPFAQKWWETK